MTSRGHQREDARALTHDRPNARDPARVLAAFGEFGAEVGNAPRIETTPRQSGRQNLCSSLPDGVPIDELAGVLPRPGRGSLPCRVWC